MVRLNPGGYRPRIASSVLAVPLWLLAAFTSGCAHARTGAFDGHFEAGRYREAVEAAEADPGQVRGEQGLYRLALAHLAPGTAVYDPLRAEGLLNELLARHPHGAHALVARILAGQLAAARRTEMAVHRAQHRADSVARELEGLRATREALEARAGAGTQELERLRVRVRTLEGDLRAREEEVAGLQRTLDELKRIDLRRSGAPPPVPLAPPAGGGGGLPPLTGHGESTTP